MHSGLFLNLRSFSTAEFSVCIRICANGVKFGPVFVAYDNSGSDELATAVSTAASSSAVATTAASASCLVAKVYKLHFYGPVFLISLHEVFGKFRLFSNFCLMGF